MKNHTKNAFLLLALIAGLNLIPAGRVTAQIFTYSGEGANPYAGLILSGQTLYGTASGGGSSGLGTLFAVGTNGAGFATLHSFTGASDGASPAAGLITNSSGSILYGTTVSGVVRAMARCSQSTPMAPGLRTCIASQQRTRMVSTAMELIPMPD